MDESQPFELQPILTAERDPIWKVPPFEIVEEYDWEQARAFAETIPEHVELKGGHQLRDRFDRGKGVKVAVLDTGISKRHVQSGDLQNCFKDARDFTGSRYSWDDLHGHGTHCAGIIAADNEDTGTSSILDQCELYAGKVLGDSGSGSSAGIARGVDWAVENGCHVISMSLGGGYSSATHQALRRAEAAGVCVVAAAGNSGRRGVGYPAANNDVCHSIAAVDFNYRIASFSSVGEANDFADFGVNVYSTYRGGGYARLSGTSMSTPNMAAVVGAVMALEFKILGKLVTRRLAEWDKFFRDPRWLVDRGSRGSDSYYGHGTINFPSLIDTYEGELKKQPGPGPKPPPPGENDFELTIPVNIPPGHYILDYKRPL